MTLAEMRDETELKPASCPFCGCADQLKLRHAANLSPHVAYITCDECCACGPYANTDAGALRLWNKRAAS